MPHKALRIYSTYIYAYCATLLDIVFEVSYNNTEANKLKGKEIMEKEIMMSTREKLNVLKKVSDWLLAGETMCFWKTGPAAPVWCNGHTPGWCKWNGAGLRFDKSILLGILKKDKLGSYVEVPGKRKRFRNFDGLGGIE